MEKVTFNNLIMNDMAMDDMMNDMVMDDMVMDDMSNMTMNDDMMMMDEMSMVMTFNDNYKIKIVFDFWDIKTMESYLWSCFLVFMLVASISWFKYLIRKIKIKNTQTLLIHSSLLTIDYGLCLIVMLISMTYNYGLFISILTGHFVGELTVKYKNIYIENDENDANYEKIEKQISHC